MTALDAVRTHRSFRHCEHQVRRLEQIEQVFFPRQVFVSAGLMIGYQECSICEEEYGHCGHIAGRPYWGQLCYIIARDFEGDHVAIVENPADKRCRVVGFRVGGGERNRMTWKIGPLEAVGDEQLAQLADSEGHLITRAVLMHANMLRYRRK